MNNFQDNLFEAISLISKTVAAENKSDTTIKATVTGIENASSGYYQITQDKTTYDAYSQNGTYELNDEVLVLVPQGDYSNQKTILSKVVPKTVNESVSYKNTFVKFTDNLVPGMLEQNLIANSSNQEQIIYSTNLNSVNYSRLYLSADFKALLNSFGTIEGKYGLKVEIREKNADDNRSLYLSTKEMFGNVYNTVSYTNQSIMYDISDCKNIERVTVYFYQEEGSFKDSDGLLIPIDEFPNIFVNNIELYLGEDASSLTVGQDQLILSTSGTKTYNTSAAIKEVQLKWIHWDGDTPSLITSFDNDGDYEVKWFKYNLFAAVDKQLQHDRDNGEGEFAKFQTQGEREVYYKKKIDAIKNNSYVGENWQEQDIYNNSFNFSFNPDLSLKEEQIQAMVIQNSIPKYSSVLTFDNINYTMDNSTAEITFTLSDNSDGNYYLYGQDNIIIKDEDSNLTRELTASLYEGENNLLDVSQIKESLEEQKKVIEEDLTLSDISNSTRAELNIALNQIVERINNIVEPIIEWEIPSEHSMISVIGFSDDKLTLSYTINDLYSAYDNNNQISCTITTPGGIRYEKTIQLQFGQAGITGADATIRWNYYNNEQLIKNNKYYYQNAVLNQSNEIILKLNLFDETNKKIDISKIENFNDYISFELYKNGKLLELIGEEQQIPEQEEDNDEPQETCKVAFEFDSSNGILIITLNENINIDTDLFILKTYIKDYFDFTITSRFPIAITSGIAEYNFINGVKEVIYSSFGTPMNYNIPYELFDYNNNKVDTDVTWNILSKDERETATITNNNLLQPSFVYINNCIEYGVQAKISGETVWTQPILLTQNTNISNSISEWDGKNVTIGDNSVIAPMIAAGEKTNDGSFTGITMGKINDQPIGLYGFQQNIATFGFKSDGEAFIGPAGLGQIKISGNSGSIQSNSFNDEYGKGLKLDFVNSKLQFKNSNYYINLDASSNGSIPLQIGTNENPNFKVDWDGGITSTKGIIGGWGIQPGCLKKEGNNSDKYSIYLSTNRFQFRDSFAIYEGSDNKSSYVISKNLGVLDQLKFHPNGQVSNLYKIVTKTSNTITLAKNAWYTFKFTQEIPNYLLVGAVGIYHNGGKRVKLQSFYKYDKNHFYVKVSTNGASSSTNKFTLKVRLLFLREESENIEYHTAKGQENIIDEENELNFMEDIVNGSSTIGNENITNDTSFNAIFINDEDVEVSVTVDQKDTPSTNYVLDDSYILADPQPTNQTFYNSGKEYFIYNSELEIYEKIDDYDNSLYGEYYISMVDEDSANYIIAGDSGVSVSLSDIYTEISGYNNGNDWLEETNKPTLKSLQQWQSTFDGAGDASGARKSWVKNNYYNKDESDIRYQLKGTYCSENRADSLEERIAIIEDILNINN